MWLGEQINERGIGNGISLIIFAGIVARMPGAIWALIVEIRNGLNVVFVMLAAAMFVAVIVLVIYEQRGQRKIPVNYAKRVVGRKMYGAQSSYIPFKINPSGSHSCYFCFVGIDLPHSNCKRIGCKCSLDSEFTALVKTRWCSVYYYLHFFDYLSSRIFILKFHLTPLKFPVR